MSEEKAIRINKVLRELNITLDRVVDYLKEQGIAIESNVNTKISQDIYEVLCTQFSLEKGTKEATKELGEKKRKEKEISLLERQKDIKEKQEDEIIKVPKTVIKSPVPIGKIDLTQKNKKTPPKEKEEPPQKENPPKATPAKKEKLIKAEPQKSEDKKPEIVVESEKQPEKKSEKKADKKSEEQNIQAEEEKLVTKYQKLSGITLTGQTVDIARFEEVKKKKEEPKITPNKPGTPPITNKEDPNKNRRKRIITPNTNPNTNTSGGNKIVPNAGKLTKPVARPGFVRGNRPPIIPKVEPTEEEVKNQIRETLEKLQGKGNKSKAAKYRRDKRDTHRQKSDDEQRVLDEGSKTIKVTEFVTVGEIAIMMDVPITKVIGTCMSLGIMVTMNQRLDAETLTIVADEFGYDVEFITVDIEEAIQVIEDKEEDLTTRAPIVTVMGHVDHGKTSLLDYIRKENVIAGESGGITQHIGAYSVELDNGQKITFLDTPGHEAFTAMRARGTQVTDIVIIVIAADDDIMPQTKEAISHAQAAGVPLIFAINKIDKPNANPEKIKEYLAGMNLLVEDWGGKIQSQDISAKTGTGVKELLEKILLEAEILELKANSNKLAQGSVIEAFLDKGKGYVSTILVQQGTLKVGDYMLAGKNHGKIKAMHDERGNIVKEAGPSTPVSVLGLDGAPTAGDKFNVFEDEKEAKQIASKRSQLMREQSVRTQRHITLDEIGRRIALGQFKELNVILKGDVDGSVEALSDSFSKLSTEQIQINIIHKGVGAITETDVMLASASDAIIIGFNVRPAGNARQLAEKEEIDIRFYSIIYAAIDDLKDAMEGLLAPEMKEEILGSAEIREIFKISKIGSIAGCMITDGKVTKVAKVRVLRDGVVQYSGELAALKRFKDDVKEVLKGYDCGIQIKGFNDIEQGDIIEAYHEIAIKKKLK